MKFYGIISERDNERRVLIQNIRTHKTFLLTFTLGDAVEVVIQKPKKERTTSQNKYYFGVCIDYISDHTGYEPREVHEEMKRLHNPKPSKFIQGETVGGSTAKLTTVEFGDYIDRIVRWAALELGVVIPDAGEME